MVTTTQYSVRLSGLDECVTRRARAADLTVAELIRRDLERYYAIIAEPVALSPAELEFVRVSAAPYAGKRLGPANLWEFVQDGDEDEAIAAGLDLLELAGRVRALPLADRCAIVDSLETVVDSVVPDM